MNGSADGSINGQAMVPPKGQAEFLAGYEHHRAGRLAEAGRLYRAATQANPDHVDALHLLGTILAQLGQPAAGEALIKRALRFETKSALIWSNYGNVLDLLARRAEAISAFEQALALEPDHVDAVINRARVLLMLGRAGEALQGFEHASRIAPGRPAVGIGRGNALLALGRPADALALYEAVLAVVPDNLDARINRGTALKDLGRHAEALAAFDDALRRAPSDANASFGRAHALVLAGRPSEALAAVQPLLARQPPEPFAWYVHGHALLGLLDLTGALASFGKAAELKPDFVEAIYNRADALRALGRYPEAMPEFERVLAIDPEHTHALSGLASSAMHCCDWTVTSRLAPRLEAKVRAGRAQGVARGLMPFSFLSLSGSQELQLDCARLQTAHSCPMPATPLWSGTPTRRDRIRLGYLSADYRRHAMAYQMVELFELHDRDRFEVIGVSAGVDDGSPIRQRIMSAFDRWHDVAAMRDADIAALMHREGIDIAIDLNGHTIHSRLGALAHRPAPVQVTYLGFPGTSGASFIDYVIADAVVAPFDDQRWFTEAIVHLPDCYQVSDSQRRFSHLSPKRADYGLPDDAFVFCCFNSSYKISAEIFAVWMRILKARSGSVLWLVRGSDTMRDNLRRAAADAGVNPNRLMFCDVVEPDAHLARHALADLYLDTLPYNSHGTGSFALWGGLPMLTCLGPTFAGRVCASLLGAIGLPELVTHSLADYEALALKLADDPALLAAVRVRLAANRTAAPLFDTDRFRRNIEAAYTTMWERALAGEKPVAFAVDAAHGRA